MVDYGLLPPEINSARMYSGPGSGSLVAAAAGWGELAAELHSTAAGLQSVISTLTSGPWVGPASASLVAASTPYVGWLQSSATHSELAAGQAAAAASAHDTAFGLTVPPPVIEANRVLLAALLATNFLGQNAPAIAAAEADYFEFWAQDAAAMYGYASSSLAAAQLSDFEEPPEVADSSGVARQATAVSTAVENSSTTETLKDLAASFSSKTIDEWIVANTPLDDFVALYSKYLGPFMAPVTSTAQSTNAAVAVTGFMKGLLPAASSAAKATEGAASALGAAATQGVGQGAAGLTGVAAGVGRAVPLGALSVPPSWAPVTAVTNPGVAALNSAVAGPAAAAEGVGGLPMTPLGPMFSQMSGRNLPTYGFRPMVMAKPPSAG